MSVYEKGFIDGVSAFAWWKDGKQQVGTTGKLLAEVKNNPRACYGFDEPTGGAASDLEDMSIGDLIELIEAARATAQAKQARLRADSGCSCHIAPPCSFCIEGGSREIP
jgi:hypothetical protein